VKTFKDFEGKTIRLTEERLRHILDHPEMRDKIESIAETLKTPQAVIESLSDPRAHLYYRYYLGTRVGDKYLCVVVKIQSSDAFVLTAYLTDAIKEGRQIWPEKS
jgi:hypothetical protein